MNKNFIFVLFLIVYGTLSYASNQIPLFRKFPELKDISRVEFLEGPTPIRPLSALENYFYRKLKLPIPSINQLWVKMDDRSHVPLGGNKARKLEFLLGEAKKNGVRKIITAGMWGSNHAYSTTLAAREMGIDVSLISGPQPVTKNVQKKLLANYALGAKLQYYPKKWMMGFGIAKAWIRSKLFKKIYYIPPGGTSPVGTLGYVNAFLELLEQVGVDGLPEKIILPMGTAGTSAGLLVGSCLGGVYEKTQIIAVGISHDALSNEHLVRKTAKQVYRYIKKRMGKNAYKLPKCDFKKSKKALVYIKKYSDPGYGSAYPEVFGGMKLAQSLEGITLDQTYSAKAFRYFLDEIERELKLSKKLSKKTMFWLTYNSYKLDSIINNFHWKNPQRKWEELPRPFHKLFQ